VSDAIPTTKPYLFRAIYEWAEDNSFTPQVLVNAEIEGVLVPQDYIVDGQIVLNISSSASQVHQMDNDGIAFSARFKGVSHDIFLPMESVLAIFARENSQGIFFEDTVLPDPVDPKPNGDKPKLSKTKPARKPDDSSAPKGNGSHLKIVK